MTRCWLAVVVLLLGACRNDALADLGALPLSDEARAAAGRLRFVPLRDGDAVLAGELVLCGSGDEVVLGFSRRLISDYLGIDSEYLLPELFDRITEQEVFLRITSRSLFRLQIPAGIGTQLAHPAGRVRETRGTPRRSGDLRALALYFSAEELTAVAPANAVPPAEAAKPAPLRTPRGLGILAFPRMGPRAGVVLEKTLAGSPAARAGLRTGDRILAVNGRTVGDLRDLQGHLAATVDPLVVLSVRRRGSESVELVEVVW